MGTRSSKKGKEKGARLGANGDVKSFRIIIQNTFCFSNCSKCNEKQIHKKKKTNQKTPPPQCHTALNNVINENGDSLVSSQEKANTCDGASHMSSDNPPTLSALWESEKKTLLSAQSMEQSLKQYGQYQIQRAHQIAAQVSFNCDSILLHTLISSKYTVAVVWYVFAPITKWPGNHSDPNSGGLMCKTWNKEMPWMVWI